ncbi:MAG: ABC transporter ATP-binding protein [Magnetococcales bacterium]|nr:ABC transporter ATP-binding protein [Magnetococcales bacterium]
MTEKSRPFFSYWRVMREMMRFFPWRGLTILVCLVISSTMEGVGLASLLPVFNLSLGAAGGPASEIQKLILQPLEYLGLPTTLGMLLGVIALALLIKALTKLFAMTLVGYAAAHIITHLRLELIRGLTEAKWGYFTGQPVGRLSNALGMEATRAASAFMSGTEMTASLIRSALLLGTAIFLSWQVCLAAVIVSLLIYFILKNTVHGIHRAGQDKTRLSNQMLIRLADTLQGMKPLKAMARENRLLPFLEKLVQGLNLAERQMAFNRYVMASMPEPIMALFMAIGIHQAVTRWHVDLSVLMVLALLFSRIVGTFGVLQLHLQNLMDVESAYWSLREAITHAQAEEERSEGRTPPGFHQAIRMENVSFAFGEKQLLKDLSLEIPAGQFVTIAGPSGAGKTTLVDMIIGLYRPQQGEITIDGFSMADMDLRAWRRRIGYVPQEMFLFHDTILANLTLGDDSVTLEAVQAALQQAEAWDFVQSLPEGLHTVIGERGSKLSGGQRQRIAIARALLGNPDLLILDESTTALDPPTERAICQTLRGLAGRVTILAITHQTELVQAADRVFQVANGKILQIENKSK